MRSVYDFIVRPIKTRYKNTVKIGDIDLVVNTKIENHLSVSKEAIVIATPLAYVTPIKPGDHVYVHHNVFRRFYDVKGKERNSRSYFKEDMYFCDPLQVYMYNLTSHLDYCFVLPIKNKSYLSTSNEQLQCGILKYGNNALEAKKIYPETLVTFSPDSEFEFIINGERLYCMKSNNIVLTHERKGNEEEYNPSWASSC